MAEGDGGSGLDQLIENLTAPAAPGGVQDQQTTMQEMFMPWLQPDLAASGGGSGQFTVMPAQIPQAIALFEQARDDMEQLANRLRRDAVVNPPGNDMVSQQVAEAMTNAGVQGPESAAGAAELAMVEFQRVVDALTATGRTYGVVDADTAGTFNA